MLESSNDLFSTTSDLLTFQRALLGGELFSDTRSLELLTERRNRLRNIPSSGTDWAPCSSRSVGSCRRGAALSRSSATRSHRDLALPLSAVDRTWSAPLTRPRGRPSPSGSWRVA